MRGKFFRRVAPFVAFVAVLTQGNLGWAGKTTTTTTLTKAEIVDGMSVDQNLILSQKDGKGTEAVNAYSAPSVLSLDMEPGYCSNKASAAGPMITLSGSLDTKPVNMQMRIQNSSKAGAGDGGTFWNGSASVSLRLDQPIAPISKKGVYASDGTSGVGGNPWIYIRFKNAGGLIENQEWLPLGRCVQGTDGASLLAALNLPGRRFFRLASSKCSTSTTDSGGTVVSFLHRGGPRLKGQLAFTNQRIPAGMTSLTDAQHYYAAEGTKFDAASIGLTLQSGAEVTPNLKGQWAGGNPAFGAQFEATPGAEDFGPVLMLGRCKDLAGVEPTGTTIDWSY